MDFRFTFIFFYKYLLFKFTSRKYAEVFQYREVYIFSNLFDLSFKNFDNFEKNLSKCITFVLISIMISMVYQYYNGSIFGVTPFTNHGFGLSGFFKDEYISGSVISKLFFFSLPFINTFKKNQIFTLLYLLIGSVCFIS